MFLAYLEKYPDGEFRSLADIQRAADAPSGLASLSGLLNTAFSTDNRVTEASREGFPSG